MVTQLATTPSQTAQCVKEWAVRCCEFLRLQEIVNIGVRCPRRATGVPKQSNKDHLCADVGVNGNRDEKA